MKKVAVVLIEPYGGKVQHSADYYKKGNIAPPYALETLAGYLLEKLKVAEVNVSIIHQRAFKAENFEQLEGGTSIIIETRDIVDMCREQAAKADQLVVGLRAVTPIYIHALKIAQAIKKSIPTAVIIMGGYYVSEVKGKFYEGSTYKKLEKEIS